MRQQSWDNEQGKSLPVFFEPPGLWAFPRIAIEPLNRWIKHGDKADGNNPDRRHHRG